MKMLGGTYIITGITGFIGSAITKELMNTSEYLQGNIKIIGIARDYSKAEKMYCEFNCINLYIVETDIVNACDCKIKIMNIADNADFFIHCAATTISACMIAKPVETADGIVIGTSNMLEISRALNIKSFVYLSSMEVYGKVEDIGRLRREDELGNIDLSSVRSCYSLGKRMAEHYCYIYQKEYGVHVKVARLAQVFGRGVRLTDNRVYMQFARAAYEGRDIILKTQGTSMGNYCSSKDAVEAILTILDRGIDGEAYNVVNEANTMCIREMAGLVASEIAGGKISVRVELEDAEKTGYAPDTGLRLSGEKMRQLGWEPSQDLIEMYQEVIEEIKSHDRRPGTYRPSSFNLSSAGLKSPHFL